MTIFRGSRYARLDVTTVRDIEGRLRQFLHDRNVVEFDDLLADFTIHKVQLGDALDVLAFKFGNKATLWWIIADVNGLDSIFDIEPGDELVIPAKRFFARF